MTTNRRQVLAYALVAAAFSIFLAARQLGIFQLGSAGNGFDVLLLIAAFCSGCASVIIFLLRDSGRNR